MKKLLAILLFAISANTTAIATDDSKYHQSKTCLAETIYREARGEPHKGKLAVAQVVLNRVKHKNYPASVCGVVFQKHQFPWTHRLKKFRATPEYYDLADKVLMGEHPMKHFKATHFHAKYVNPKWKLSKIATIGNHIFYKL